MKLKYPFPNLVGLVLILISGAFTVNYLININVQSQQQIIRGGGGSGGGTNTYLGYYNTLNTNLLGTNLLYDPIFHDLKFYGNQDGSSAGIAMYNTNGNLTISLTSDGTAYFYTYLLAGGGFQYTNGAFSGAILQSDANGVASWVTNSGSSSSGGTNFHSIVVTNQIYQIPNLLTYSGATNLTL